MQDRSPRGRLLTVVALTLLLWLPGACGSDEIRRADLSEWRTLEQPLEGVVVDVPKDAFRLQLHSKSTGIGDAVWYIEGSIERKSAADFDNPPFPSPGNPASDNEHYMTWLRWLHTFHPEVSEFRDGPNRQYRRDLRLPGGDVVSGHIRYRYSHFTPAERTQDIDAIHRMLMSIRPIADR